MTEARADAVGEADGVVEVMVPVVTFEIPAAVAPRGREGSTRPNTVASRTVVCHFHGSQRFTN